MSENDPDVSRLVDAEAERAEAERVAEHGSHEWRHWYSMTEAMGSVHWHHCTGCPAKQVTRKDQRGRVVERYVVRGERGQRR